MSGREPSGGTKTQPTGAPPRPREPGLPTQASFSVCITIPRFVGEEQVTEDVNDSRLELPYLRRFRCPAREVITRHHEPKEAVTSGILPCL